MEPTLIETKLKRRRTQAERSAEMQERILTAALDCITEMGLQNASTHEIGRAAKISRGALLHHYPTRIALLKAAFGKVLDDEVQQLANISTKVRSDGSSLGLIVDYIWERYKGRLFLVTVDYLSLARVDDETLAAVSIEAFRFNEKLNGVWDKCLADVDVSFENRRAHMNQTMCLVRGMALQRIWRHDEIYFEQMLKDWVTHLSARFNL